MRNYSALRDNSDIHETITLSVGVEAADVITVALQVVQAGGQQHVDGFPPMACYMAEAANGLVLEVPSGGVAAGTRGTVSAKLTDGSIFTVIPDSNGFADIAVTQTGADTLFMIIIDPEDGTIIASAALTFA